MKKGVGWNKVKKISLLVVIILVLLVIPIASGGFSGMWNMITGALPSSTTTLSISINAAPFINWTSNSTSYSITEAGTMEINFSFWVTDTDGVDEINNISAALTVTHEGHSSDAIFDGIYTNRSCVANSTVDTVTVSFNCTVNMYYWSAPGLWNVNVSINDTNGAYTENITQTFEILSTTAMVMSPTALTWSTLALGATNATPSDDPIVINNTGNKNFSAGGGITVTANDLQGLTTTTEFLGVGNFTVAAYNGSVDCTGADCLECNGTFMVNETAESLVVANITAGNNSIAAEDGTSGQEQLFFCLNLIPSQMSRQTYDTSGLSTDPWTITVS